MYPPKTLHVCGFLGTFFFIVDKDSGKRSQGFMMAFNNITSKEMLRDGHKLDLTWCKSVKIWHRNVAAQFRYNLQLIHDDRDELKWEECPEFLTKSFGCSKSVRRGQSRNRYWSSFESDKPFKEVSSPLHTRSFSSTGHVSMMSSLRFRVSITALFRDLERARLSHSREGHCATHTSDKTDAIRKPISLWHASRPKHGEVNKEKWSILQFLRVL